MSVIVSIVGAGATFAAAFAAWYTLWHRRLATSFEEVPVGTRRSAHVLRRGVSLGDHGD